MSLLSVKLLKSFMSGLHAVAS